jgi:hypothetical protein
MTPESVINRIRMLLGYVDVLEIRNKFKDLSEDTFFLYYIAAVRLSREE